MFSVMFYYSKDKHKSYALRKCICVVLALILNTIAIVPII